MVKLQVEIDIPEDRVPQSSKARRELTNSLCSTIVSWARRAEHPASTVEVSEVDPIGVANYSLVQEKSDDQTG